MLAVLGSELPLAPIMLGNPEPELLLLLPCKEDVARTPLMLNPLALHGASNPPALDAEPDLILPLEMPPVNVGVPLLLDIAEPGRGVGLGLGGPSDSVPSSASLAE